MAAVATRVLTPDQIAAFNRDGFIVLPDVLGADLLERLRANLDDLLRNGVATAAENADFSIERADGATSIRKINNFVRYGEVWWELAAHPTILGATRDLIGSEVRLHHTKLMVKPPYEGSAKEWHQDLASYAPREEHPGLIAQGRAVTPEDAPLVAAQTYLDDSTPENGCLQFIPGSHTWGLLDAATLARDEPLPGAPVIEAPARAGSVALFHCMILHYSAPNLSPHPRRGPIVQYMPGPEDVQVPLKDNSARVAGFGHRF